jgi:cytochrome c peroxidase
MFPTMRTLVLMLSLIACKRSPALTEVELGERIFHDPNLSEPPGQACADCHDRARAFSDPEDDRTSMGAVEGRMGVRNAQTAMYASFAPPLHRDPQTGHMIGGLFWDGRVDTLEQQAMPPFLNPLEMNLPSRATLVERIRRADYADAFLRVYGPDALDDVDRAFAHVVEAVATFERSPALAPFTSKYDQYLAGQALLDEREERGLAIFEDPARGNCASCHPSRSPDRRPLFTDFSYANIGVPRFADNPFYRLPLELNPAGGEHVDRGLAVVTGDPAHEGLFRVPTLRNVTRTGPYTHNGYFRRLDDLIAHKSALATRAPPEVPGTVDREHFGRLALSRQDIADLIAFLKTLEDR